jgi:hypothetical protein
MTYASDAIARLRSIFKDTDVEDLIDVIFERLDDLETARAYIYDNFNIDDAEGVWLNYLGTVVGYERPLATHPYSQMFAFKDGSTQADYIDDPYKAFREYTEAYGSELVTNGGFPAGITGWTNNSILPGTAVHDVDAAKMLAGSGITELVTNGGFPSDISSWTTGTTGTATVTWDAGTMKFNSGSSGTAYAYQDITTVIGSKYTVEIETVSTSAGVLDLAVYSSDPIQLVDENINSVDSYSFNFEAITTTTRIQVEFEGAESVSKVDNISCYLISPANAGILDQAVAVEVGETYEFSFDVKAGSDTSATGETYVRVGTQLGQKDLYNYVVAATGVQTRRFTAITTGAYIRLYCENDGLYLKIDDVSLKKVTATLGTDGGYFQELKGLPHQTDPTVEMTDTLYRERVRAKGNANNTHALLSDVFTFFKNAYGIDEPVVSEGLYWAGITLYGKDLAEQQDRYLFNLHGPHSACVSLNVLNWTFEYRPFSQGIVADPANFTIEEDTIRRDWIGIDGVEILVDGDMELEDVDEWGVGNTATITKETTNPLAGSRVIRITKPTDWGDIRQTLMTAGKFYRCLGNGRSDGATSLPSMWNHNNQEWIGNTNTTWQTFDETFEGDGALIRFQKANADGNYTEFDNCSLLDLNEPCKVLTCDTADVTYIDAVTVFNRTTAQCAYGTWTTYFYYPATNSFFFVFIADAAQGIYHATQDGYAIYVSGGGELRFAKITAGVASSFWTTGNSYVSDDYWHKLVVTRTSDNEFTAWLDGTLVNTSGGIGTNPHTDATYTTGTYQVIQQEAGGKTGLSTLEDVRLQDYEPLA